MGHVLIIDGAVHSVRGMARMACVVRVIGMIWMVRMIVKMSIL